MKYKQEDIIRLSQKNTQRVQRDTLRAFIEDTTIESESLLFSGLPPECWENAALVLMQWGSPRVDSLVPQLLEWLQDLNWPGAEYILLLLYAMPCEKIQPALNAAVLKAQTDGDEGWLLALDYLVNHEAHKQDMHAFWQKKKEDNLDSFGEVLLTGRDYQD